MSVICQTFLEDLWQSEDGARVIMFCLAFSSAKDRKVMIKTFSDSIDSMCTHPYGSNVLKFCLSIVDDTVLLRKQVVQHIADVITTLWTSTPGMKLLLHILAPDSQRYFSATELNTISIPTLYFEAGMGKYYTYFCILERDSFVVSKKDSALRRNELLGDKILPTIVNACVSSQETLNFLIRAATESAILIESLRLAKDTDYGKQALTAVAQLVAEPVSDSCVHVLSHPVAHRILKRIILFENPSADALRYERHAQTDKVAQKFQYSSPSVASGFASSLHKLLTGHYFEWAQTCGAFVIVAILENSDLETVKSIIKELKGNLKVLEKDAKAGATLLCNFLKANLKL